jgi:signal transduction histidine kinase
MTNPGRDPLSAAQAMAARLHTQAATDGDSLAALRALLEAAAQAAETSQAHDAEFVALMVHELRKPLTSIRGYADMLSKPGMIGNLNESQQQFVETILANAQRMEGLISDVSDLYKLLHGRLKLENTLTAFNTVLPEVQKATAPLAAQFAHTLEFAVPEGLPALAADARQLAKVLIHLVRNAILYTPKGGQVRFQAEVLPAERVRFAISDSGIGMRPDFVARLGAPFVRADDELVTQQRGYGLGVAVSMGLLALMSSQLELQSAPGAGTTASFTLRSVPNPGAEADGA